MSWTERLNDALPRVRLGAAVVHIHEWAHSDQPADGPPHRHSYFVVSRVEAGEGEFTAAERPYHVRPGDLTVARPGVRHRTAGAQGFRRSWIGFEVTPGPDEDDASIVLQGFLVADSVVVRNAAAAGALWELLKDTARGPRTPGQTATLAALAPALLLSLVRAAGGDGLARQGGGDRRPRESANGRIHHDEAREPSAASGEWAEASEGLAVSDDRAEASDDLAAPDQLPDRHLRAVRLAVRYIADNLDRPLRVEELAKQVNVSPRQLTRLFATVLNEPPASYVERVRLERAAGLLTRTETPIKQIAADLGYPDVPTFTRAFTRQHQSPPGRFRRATGVNGDRD